MLPFSREHFGRDSPSGDVCDLEDGLQVFGQMLEHCLKLLRLEESFPRVVLAEHPESRQLSDLFAGQSESAFQRGKLAVDRRIRRLLFLAIDDVCAQSVFRDVDRPRIAEELAQDFECAS